MRSTTFAVASEALISNCLWKNIRKLRRMKGLLCVLSVLVVVLIYSETCAAISCVQCKSHKFQDCDDEFKKNDHTSKYYKPCEGPYANATACRKIVQEVYIINDWENKKGDWQRRVIRQCANHVGKMDCIDRTGTYRVKTKYCHCDTENCNGSASVKMSFFLIAASIIMSVGRGLFTKKFL